MSTTFSKLAKSYFAPLYDEVWIINQLNNANNDKNWYIHLKNQTYTIAVFTNKLTGKENSKISSR